LNRCRKTIGTRVESFTPEALEILKSYPWPGNVRELKNVVENLAMRVHHPMIQSEDLSLNQSKRTLLEMTEKRNSLDEMVSAFEKQLIEEALRKSNGIFTHAATLLGTTRRILKYHIDQLNIPIQKKNRRSKS
jgi:DNA-binding NtrC family response regulator